MIRDLDPVIGALVIALGAIVLICVFLVIQPVVHHVGDTRYCTGTGVGMAGTKPVVITLSVPCGTYASGDPDVTR